MIVFGGGGFGLLALLAVFVLLLGGGDLLPVLLLVVAGVLVLRAVRRSSRPRYVEPAWQPPAARSGWEPPQQPVLPPVAAADVSSLRDRLGHDVATLDPGADPVARQAMADASERYATAGTLLERASSDAQLRTAWLAAVEGLHATRTVRQRQGLDAGPPVPTLPATGAPLTRTVRLDVEGRSYTGAPSYEPGRPHWFPGGSYGGRHVPGGWYDAPFWPSSLVLGALSGWALGGLMAGAMYGDDLAYGDGGHGGVEDAGEFGGFGGGGGWEGGGEADLGGGGDWGGFGGGDSGGGGDWGGGDGGGDW